MTSISAKELNTPIFHGTPKVFEIIELPKTMEYTEGRDGRDEYGIGFYVGINAQEPDKASGYASSYAKNAGILLEGNIATTNANFINLDEPINDATKEKLLSAAKEVATTNEFPNAIPEFYQKILSRQNEAKSGLDFLRAVIRSNITRYEESKGKLKLNLEQSDTLEDQLHDIRRTVRDNLDPSIDPFSDKLSASDCDAIKQQLLKAAPDDPIVKPFIQHLVDKLPEEANGELLMKQLGAGGNGIKSVVKFHDERASNVQLDITSNDVDSFITTTLNKAGYDGYYIPSQDTMVYKGEGVKKIPPLTIKEIIGTGPNQNDTGKSLEVGRVMVKPSSLAFVPSPRTNQGRHRFRSLG